MGRKTFSAPLLLTGQTSASGPQPQQLTVLEVSGTGVDDSNPSLPVSATIKGVLEATGDLISQNVGGMKVALGPWTSVNLLTNQSVALNVAGLATIPEISVPYAGSLLGITLNLQTSMTAGTLTVQATKNGTTIATLKATAVIGAGNLAFRATQNKDVTPLVVGDRIGAKVVSGTAYAPTTNDPVITVYVDQ